MPTENALHRTFTHEKNERNSRNFPEKMTHKLTMAKTTGWRNVWTIPKWNWLDAFSYCTEFKKNRVRVGSSNSLEYDINNEIMYRARKSGMEHEEIKKVMDLANWMDDMKEEIKDKNLNEIVIPGSHDSGTYCINSKSKYGSKHIFIMLQLLYIIFDDFHLNRFVFLR